MAEKKEAKPKREKFKTPIGILTWAYIYKPDDKKFNNQKDVKNPQFKAALMIPKTKDQVKGCGWNEDLKPLKIAVLGVARAKWGKDVKYSDLEVPFKDGDETAANSEEVVDDKGKKTGKRKLDYLKGFIHFTAKTTFKPGVVGPDLQPLPEGENVASGDYVRLSLTAYAYGRTSDAVEIVDGKKKKIKLDLKGISFSLENVQKVHQGKRFEGERQPEKDFDSVEGIEFDDEVADLTDTETDDGEVKSLSKGKAKKGKSEPEPDDSEFEDSDAPGDSEEIPDDDDII